MVSEDCGNEFLITLWQLMQNQSPSDAVFICRSNSIHLSDYVHRYGTCKERSVPVYFAEFCPGCIKNNADSFRKFEKR